MSKKIKKGKALKYFEKNNCYYCPCYKECLRLLDEGKLDQCRFDTNFNI